MCAVNSYVSGLVSAVSAMLKFTAKIQAGTHRNKVDIVPSATQKYVDVLWQIYRLQPGAYPPVIAAAIFRTLLPIA